MNVAFAGTPPFAATILRGLLDSSHEVGLVISQPDARRGRGRKLVKPPVGELAEAHGLRLFQPERIGEAAEEISRFDVLVVAAYGQILRADTLHAAHGAYNVHASLLPAYRGAAPIERSIMAGETETGVSIMRMDEGLDTGPVALQKRTPIPPEITGGELAERLAKIGSQVLVESLDSLEAGSLRLEEQDDSRASYAPKVSPEEREIPWGRSSGEVHDLIRALSPHIGARTMHADVSGAVRILRSRVSEGAALEPGEILTSAEGLFAGCGEGVLEILELQLSGGKPLSSRDFLRGHHIAGRFGG